MHSFFASMLNQSSLALPPDILSLLRFRIDYKQTSKFILRDGIYVVSYTDGSYDASQAIASSQPSLTSEGILFTSHLLKTNNLGDIQFVVVVANHDGAFSPYKPFVSGFQGGVPYPSIMGQSGSDMFDGNGSQYTQSDIRMNNVLSSDFSPNTTYKAISAKFGTKTSNIYDIGSNTGNGSMQGTIKDVLFFHTEPSEPQKTVIQNYLEAYHSLL